MNSWYYILKKRDNLTNFFKTFEIKHKIQMNNK